MYARVSFPLIVIQDEDSLREQWFSSTDHVQKVGSDRDRYIQNGNFQIPKYPITLLYLVQHQ